MGEPSEYEGWHPDESGVFRKVDRQLLERAYPATTPPSPPSREPSKGAPPTEIRTWIREKVGRGRMDRQAIKDAILPVLVLIALTWALAELLRYGGAF